MPAVEFTYLYLNYPSALIMSTAKNFDNVSWKAKVTVKSHTFFRDTIRCAYMKVQINEMKNEDHGDYGHCECTATPIGAIE